MNVEHEKTPKYLESIIEDNRFVYDVDYSVYTIKESREQMIHENVKIPLSELIDNEELTQIISEMLHHLIEDQSKYDNYDIVRLENVSLKAIYDSEIN